MTSRSALKKYRIVPTSRTRFSGLMSATMHLEYYQNIPSTKYERRYSINRSFRDEARLLEAVDQIVPSLIV